MKNIRKSKIFWAHPEAGKQMRNRRGNLVVECLSLIATFAGLAGLYATVVVVAAGRWPWWSALVTFGFVGVCFTSWLLAHYDKKDATAAIEGDIRALAEGLGLSLQELQALDLEKAKGLGAESLAKRMRPIIELDCYKLALELKKSAREQEDYFRHLLKQEEEIRVKEIDDFYELLVIFTLSDADGRGKAYEAAGDEWAKSHVPAPLT